MDRCNTWYLSTVIVTEERTDAKMPMIKVGFRQYANNGDKEDSMGKFSVLVKSLTSTLDPTQCGSRNHIPTVTNKGECKHSKRKSNRN